MQTFVVTPLESGLSSPHWRYSSLLPQRVYVTASDEDDARSIVGRAFWQPVRSSLGDDSPISPWMSLTDCAVANGMQIREGTLLTETGEEIPVEDC